MESRRQVLKRYRQLMTALLGFLVTHTVALVTIALLLAPGLDAGASAAERASYIAAHPWAWRLGWLPWQLSAAADLVVSVTLWRWLGARADRAAARWAALGIAVTVVAIAADQWGEAVAVTELVDLARDANGAGLQAYATRERWFLLMTATCGNSAYVLMTLCWTLSLARAAKGVCSAKALGWLTAVTLPLFVVGSAVMARATRTSALEGMELEVVIHGVGFPLLNVWGVVAAVLIGRLHHAAYPKTDAANHRLAWPSGSALGSALAAVASSPGMRDLFRPIPFLELKSDIIDVVYLNWMVPSERVADLLPAPLELHDIDGHTAVSILSYRHGAFGPRLFGPLRKLLPSPRQSNWRLYLELSQLEAQSAQHQPKRDAIYFFKTSLSSAPHTLMSRLMADGLPAHLPAKLEHSRTDRSITTTLIPGQSHAPDLEVRIVETAETEAGVLPDAWKTFFPDWSEAVQYLVAQNRAVSVEPAQNCVLESRIDIPINVADVVPADVVAIESNWLAAIVEGCTPLAFVVPRVSFRALGERAIAPLGDASRDA
jgi:hypothetical protein